MWSAPSRVFVLYACAPSPRPTTFFRCGVICVQALCGVAAGATKTSITSHFALRANMADLSAKENAQETAVNVCGMVSATIDRSAATVKACEVGVNILAANICTWT